MIFNLLFTLLPILVLPATAAPSSNATGYLESRQAVDNIVYVTDANLFWYVLDVALHASQEPLTRRKSA
jgi:hypothetical protein